MQEGRSVTLIKNQTNNPYIKYPCLHGPEYLR